MLPSWVLSTTHHIHHPTHRQRLVGLKHVLWSGSIRRFYQQACSLLSWARADNNFHQLWQVGKSGLISMGLQKAPRLPPLLPEGITTLWRNGWLNKVDKPLYFSVMHSFKNSWSSSVENLSKRFQPEAEKTLWKFFVWMTLGQELNTGENTML